MATSAFRVCACARMLPWSAALHLLVQAIQFSFCFSMGCHVFSRRVRSQSNVAGRNIFFSHHRLSSLSENDEDIPPDTLKIVFFLLSAGKF